MNCTALLISLGLMGTVCSKPLLCPPNCKRVTDYHTPDFKHVSELGDSSVAPWKIASDFTDSGREPRIIHYAACENCTVTNMIAKPIFLQVSVYHSINRDSVTEHCKCPFKLAVGCTCVNS